jgi:predicted phosphoribosyltransferase
MSHFSTTTVKVQASRGVAIRNALIAMGYTNNQIQVHETAQPLKNYYGRNQGEAHVIVRGTRSGGGPDIGIKFLADGQASITLDAMVAGRDWEQRFVQQYSKAVIKEVATEQNYAIEEESVDAKTGEMVIIVSSQW